MKYSISILKKQINEAEEVQKRCEEFGNQEDALEIYLIIKELKESIKVLNSYAKSK